jgi:hypothetical protein
VTAGVAIGVQLVALAEIAECANSRSGAGGGGRDPRRLCSHDVLVEQGIAELGGHVNVSLTIPAQIVRVIGTLLP